MLLQPFSSIQKIDVKYFQDYKLIKKEDKNFGKNKSTDTPLIDIFNGKQ